MPFGIISAARRFFEKLVEQDVRMRELALRQPVDGSADEKDADQTKQAERELFYWGVFPIV